MTPMTPAQTAARAQIKNILGGIMIDAFANGPDRLTVLVRAGDGRRARSVLSANRWTLAIDVTEAPATKELGDK